MSLERPKCPVNSPQRQLSSFKYTIGRGPTPADACPQWHPQGLCSFPCLAPGTPEGPAHRSWSSNSHIARFPEDGRRKDFGLQCSDKVQVTKLRLGSTWQLICTLHVDGVESFLPSKKNRVFSQQHSGVQYIGCMVFTGSSWAMGVFVHRISFPSIIL